MAKIAIIVELDGVDNSDEDFAKTADILDKLKPLFVGEEGVKVYGAVRETAGAILSILKGEALDDPADAETPETTPPV